jgi:hypothetical protein
VFFSNSQFSYSVRFAATAISGPSSALAAFSAEHGPSPNTILCGCVCWRSSSVDWETVPLLETSKRNLGGDGLAKRFAKSSRSSGSDELEAELTAGEIFTPDLHLTYT